MDSNRDQTLERWCSLTILTLGALHAFAMRQAITPDGVSYVDIADNWLHQSWSVAVNGYFSPLYSWLLMAPLAVAPSAAWETPLIHVLNFGLLVLDLTAFRYFLAAFERAFPPVSRSAWIAVSYALFAWGSLYMISTGLVVPDQLYASLMFLLAGVLLRLFQGERTWTMFCLLGILWGAGYLARSAAIPVIAVSAAGAFFAAGRDLRALGRIALAGLVAALVAAPWVMALSAVKGHWTLGSTGSLIYAWHINRQPHQHARLPGMTHPTRQLAEKPAVYEFASPVVGTYPPWTDPSYWDEGMPVRIDLQANVIELSRNVKRMLALLLEMGGLLGAIAGVWIWSGAWRKPWPALQPFRWLLFFSLTGLAIYAALNVEARYFAAFWVILLLSLWAAACLESSPATVRVVNTLAAAAAFVTLLSLGEFTVAQFTLGSAEGQDLQTAEALVERGVNAGTAIATVAVDNDVHWARLARTRVVAEIPIDEAPAFWAATEDARETILNTLRAAGVRYLISGQAPTWEAGWTVIGPRPLYLLAIQ